jgi:hypothetical protein
MADLSIVGQLIHTLWTQALPIAAAESLRLLRCE